METGIEPQDQVDTVLRMRVARPFVVISYLSATLVIALAILGFVSGGGFGVLPFLLLLLGVFLLVVVVIDVPLAVVVDEVGVERRCLLRHHRLDWSRVAAFSRSSTDSGIRRYARGKTRSLRTRSGTDGVGRGRQSTATATDKSATKGGLVVEDVRRRRYLLSLGRERPDEYARLQELVGRHAPGISMPGPPFYARRAGRL